MFISHQLHWMFREHCLFGKQASQRDRSYNGIFLTSQRGVEKGGFNNEMSQFIRTGAAFESDQRFCYAAILPSGRTLADVQERALGPWDPNTYHGEFNTNAAESPWGFARRFGERSPARKVLKELRSRSASPRDIPADKPAKWRLYSRINSLKGSDVPIRLVRYGASKKNTLKPQLEAPTSVRAPQMIAYFDGE